MAKQAANGDANMETAIAALRGSVRGKVLTEETGAQYEQAREIWNKMYQDRKPLVIVQPLGNTDVIKAVNFAREHSLALAVKGGGHSVLGHGIVDGGLVVDLSLMRGVIVNEADRTAVIQGGAQLGDIDEETAPYNLMLPLGHYRGTGMGLILGGGLGVAARKYGVASDHLLSVTLVTAEGKVVTCSKEVEEDLFWACHGAAANFGVVTSVTVRLHELEPTYYGGLIVFHRDHFPQVARFQCDVGSTDPDFCMMAANVFNPEAGIPVTCCMVHYLGPKSPKEKEDFMAPLRTLGPIMDTVGGMTYAQTQDVLTAPLDAMPPVHVYWISGKLKGLPSADFIQVYADVASEAPPEMTPTSQFVLDLQGGAGFEKPAYGPLYSGASAASWYIIVCWTDPAFSKEGIAYAKSTKEKFARFSTGQEYANMASDFEQQRAHMVGGTDNLQRLQDVKAEWDPTNFFHSNHNVPLVK